MSKLKLLLLGGIFTLVGIFNFSSAENINISCTSNGNIMNENGNYSSSCNPSAILIDKIYEAENINFNNPNFSNYCEGYEICSISSTIEIGNLIFGSCSYDTELNQTICDSNIETFKSQVLELNKLGQQGEIQILTDGVSVVGDEYVIFDLGEIQINFTINTNYNEGGTGGEGGEGGQIIPGGFDNFTPAVNGLHETVKQLIPLVIYLGIGILVVILGFIVIRWLVNRMSNGIKSKFSSKRG